MKLIQWFPGHMASAIRMMEENLKLVDGVIFVLDARAFRASINPNFLNTFKNKRVLFLINKCDLVNKEDYLRAVKTLKSEGKNALAISAFDKKSIDVLKKEITSIFADIVGKYKEKGANKTVRLMVAGIPNTGKSTVINALSGAKKAETGNKAGVTRSKQWVRLSDIELLDTPGTMPPAFDNQELAKHLAYIGCVNDDVLDFPDLTLELIGELKNKYPNLLKERYKLSTLDCENIEIYNQICLNRGFIFKGKEIDYDRGANAIIDDLRKIRIGKIAFE